ncbi:MAG TPA: glycoside hydrolase family 18 protein [Oscillospiraceae bacterium]|nr:glycoside hydrolase family 18 protein [Oscillospiraceae bacterium]
MKKRIIALFCLFSIIGGIFLSGCGKKTEKNEIIKPTFTSENFAAGATVTYESLKQKEVPDAENLFSDDNKAWTPQDLNRSPSEGQKDVCNSVVEIELQKTATFNIAVIEEIGNEVQYFRLQAFIDDEWKTIYQSEKIQEYRLCSFDAVTTNKIRLSIDKFRSKDVPAKIKSLQLYYEVVDEAKDFNVTVYQRLDGDVPSEILKGTKEEIKNYARFYDVYDTVLIFGAVQWDGDNMVFGGADGEDGFARELAALREIISHRSNPSHEVKVICTGLADGTGGDGHSGVNVFMARHFETVADKLITFVEKYDLDGLDIDWEYPATKEDWDCFDAFITRLDDGMKKIKPDAILSGALSAWALGMSRETLARFNQIQFMAYDGNDEDGYQSSLDQAQWGLVQFVKNGADLKNINIGIASYGRPTNGAPYWPIWRDVEGYHLYWNSMHYNVLCADQLFDATYCSPALAGDKTAYSLLSGAGGVMVFRLACDKTMDNPNSVACGIENALIRHISEK